MVLKWFRAEGEQDVESSRALLDAQREGRLRLAVIDLTPYEVANVLLRRHGATSDQATRVLVALAAVCPTLVPDDGDRALAAALAEHHRLTFYDASYAAVSRRRGAELATLDGELLRAGLGRRPDEILALLEP